MVHRWLALGSDLSSESMGRLAEPSRPAGRRKVAVANLAGGRHVPELNFYYGIQGGEKATLVKSWRLPVGAGVTSGIVFKQTYRLRHWTRAQGPRLIVGCAKPQR